MADRPRCCDTYGAALGRSSRAAALVKVNADGRQNGHRVIDLASAETAASAMIETGAASVVVTLGPRSVVVAEAGLTPSTRLRGRYPSGAATRSWAAWRSRSPAAGRRRCRASRAGRRDRERHWFRGELDPDAISPDRITIVTAT
jgi:hypothetical protein